MPDTQPRLTQPRRRPSLWSATLQVARKEILTSFRDRQTTLYTVVLPIVLYPFLFWSMIQGALFLQGRREHTEVRVGLATDARSRVPQGLKRALEEPPPRESSEPGGREDETARARRASVNRVVVETAPAPLGEAGARSWLAEDARRDAADTRAKKPDAVLFVPAQVAPQGPSPSDGNVGADGAKESGGGAIPPQLELLYDSTKSHSDIAKKRIEERLPPFARELQEEGVCAAGFPASDLEPFEKESRDVAPEADRGAYILSFLLPMLLVIMTVMGAFFPAVDLTAGERERNTAETTLLLPVPRLAVHQGKILAVCTSALIATALNLFALALSAGHLYGMLSKTTDIQFQVPVEAFFAIAPLALLFAFFVSSVLTGIAALARTFKEGQALIGPVQMVFILPAMAGAIPGLELTPSMSFVPVLNVVLAFRSMIKGQALPLEYALTALSLLVFALLSIALTLRILSREALVGSDASVRWKDLARLWRSEGSLR